MLYLQYYTNQIYELAKKQKYNEFKRSFRQGAEVSCYIVLWGGVHRKYKLRFAREAVCQKYFVVFFHFFSFSLKKNA